MRLRLLAVRGNERQTEGVREVAVCCCGTACGELRKTGGESRESRPRGEMRVRKLGT